MPGAVYLCETDGECPRHGTLIYFCHECHMEWTEQNPLTVAVIQKMVSGRATKTELNKARAQDKANRAKLDS